MLAASGRDACAPDPPGSAGCVAALSGGMLSPLWLTAPGWLDGAGCWVSEADVEGPEAAAGSGACFGCALDLRGFLGRGLASELALELDWDEALGLSFNLSLGGPLPLPLVSISATCSVYTCVLRLQLSNLYTCYSVSCSLHALSASKPGQPVPPACALGLHLSNLRSKYSALCSLVALSASKP